MFRFNIIADTTREIHAPGMLMLAMTDWFAGRTNGTCSANMEIKPMKNGN